MNSSRLTQQYQCCIVQLRLCHQPQIYQDLFFRHIDKSLVFLLIGIHAYHFHNSIFIKIFHQQTFTFSGRIVWLLLWQDGKHFGIRHFSETFAYSHQSHTLIFQQSSNRTGWHLYNQHTFLVLIQFFYLYSYSERLIDSIFQQSDFTLSKIGTADIMRNFVLHTQYHQSTSLIRQSYNIAKYTVATVTGICMLTTIIRIIMASTLKLHMILTFFHVAEFIYCCLFCTIHFSCSLNYQSALRYFFSYPLLSTS